MKTIKLLTYFLLTLFIPTLLILKNIEGYDSSLISPVSNLAKLKIADNLWFPEGFINLNIQEPKITAKAAYFVEINSGDVLFEKNSNTKYPIASLTKIMTAIITLENKSFSDTLTVSKRAADFEPDKMLLIPGEKLTVEELMQGLFLVSANDASEVFAEEVTGRREEFIKLMNTKAALLGMHNTFFINPSGLQEDNKLQYSTAYDVALMSRYAIKKFPKLIEITSSPRIVIPKSADHQDYDLYTGINLVNTYPGVKGFKTGYTPEAGLTLVTYTQKNNREVLGVLLGSQSRREDAKILLDFSFQKLGVN